ncbi:SacI homology domain-containing protein [Amylostereum chailletii]|nr:SacI homology domain-containing protein [Amylostereum chailletii]
MKSPHERLSLYLQDEETYIFAPSESGARHLVVHRNSGDIVLAAPNAQVPVTAKRYGKTIFGILGLISLTISEYVIVITGRELRGKLLGHSVYKATDFDILPLEPGISVSNPPHPVEAHLLALVRSHLSSGIFLFSYDFDITRRLQAQWVARAKDEGKASWEVVDDRFFWNKFLQSRLIDISISNPQNGIGSYILPVINGSFDIRSTSINGRNIQLCLISRRSRFRAGTRYFRRGVDQEGHVANFNETEQIVLVSSQGIAEDVCTTLSFVQIRGSVPVFWAEVNTLRYKPDLQIMDLPGAVEATRRHLQEQVALYGNSSLVNLVDQKGYEKPVKETYERYVAEARVPDVRYQYFDFHNECKHMRWDRISLLIDSLTEDLERDGFFHVDAGKPDPVRWQMGVVRTNCMDNLDRTNVAQAAVAKWTLNQQLKEAGVISGTDSVDNYEDLSRHLREVWSDHANYISMAYAGTGALKTDFTRTGKRTREGAFEDLQKSVVRYLKNNYFDGARQDAYDLITGTWMPRRNPSSALFLVTDSRPLVIRAVPYVLMFSLFMILAGLTLPRTSDYSLFFYFCLWFSVFGSSLAFIFVYGIDYVAWPRLLPPTDTINYNGAGFRSGQKGKGLGVDIGKLKEGANAQWMAHGARRPDKQMEEIELGTKRHLD